MLGQQRFIVVMEQKITQAWLPNDGLEHPSNDLEVKCI
jgi:hypothetical protein